MKPADTGHLLVCAGSQGSPVGLWERGPAEDCPCLRWAIPGKTKALPSLGNSQSEAGREAPCRSIWLCYASALLPTPKPHGTLPARGSQQAQETAHLRRAPHPVRGRPLLSAVLAASLEGSQTVKACQAQQGESRVGPAPSEVPNVPAQAADLVGVGETGVLGC